MRITRRMNFPERVRKRLALEYGSVVIRFFHNYFLLKQEVRKGSCFKDKCETLHICCGDCRWLKNGLYTRQDSKPFGCVIFPIDAVQQKIAGLKCGYRW
jgi:hypothetical protein